MASRPFQFLEKKRSKIRKRAAKHFEGLAALSTHSTGRRAAVKTGCKPVHFSLDGCPLSCYFSGSVATLRDTLSTSRSVGRGTGAFIYLPPFSENSPIFCSFPFAKIQPVFLPEQTGRKKHRTPFPPSATPAGITHYTLQAKSCAKGASPLETPVLPGSRYSPHKSAAATLPYKTQSGGIGQPVPGADLCRLIAYMGAYCIAHINRSNLSLLYAPWTC